MAYLGLWLLHDFEVEQGICRMADPIFRMPDGRGRLVAESRDQSTVVLRANVANLSRMPSKIPNSKVTKLPELRRFGPVFR